MAVSRLSAPTACRSTWHGRPCQRGTTLSPRLMRNTGMIFANEYQKKAIEFPRRELTPSGMHGFHMATRRTAASESHLCRLLASGEVRFARWSLIARRIALSRRQGAEDTPARTFRAALRVAAIDCCDANSQVAQRTAQSTGVRASVASIGPWMLRKRAVNQAPPGARRRGRSGACADRGGPSTPRGVIATILPAPGSAWTVSQCDAEQPLQAAHVRRVTTPLTKRAPRSSSYLTSAKTRGRCERRRCGRDEGGTRTKKRKRRPGLDQALAELSRQAETSPPRRRAKRRRAKKRRNLKKMTTIH